MKQCPVCQSFVFDDIDTCYGCMHRFSMPERVTSSDQGEGSAPQLIPVKQTACEKQYDVTEDEVSRQKARGSDVHSGMTTHDNNVPLLHTCAALCQTDDASISAVANADEGYDFSDGEETKPPHDIRKLDIALNNRETVHITIEVAKTQS